MTDYTIYCTPEQTKKALKLGAPIEIKYGSDRYNPSVEELSYLVNYDHTWYKKPTAEQMIRWLEDQKEIDYIEITKGNYVGYGITWEYTVQTTDYDNFYGNFSRHNFQTRKGATLNGIDATLKYLKKHKKKEIKEKNIFEGAKYGDKYKTRDGRKAIYLCNNTCYIEELKEGIQYSHNGLLVDFQKHGIDIVSEWSEEVDKENS